MPRAPQPRALRQDDDPPAVKYAPAIRLYRLVLYLASAHYGVTIQDMQNHLGVGRRTIERLRGAIEELFPGQLHSQVTDDRTRRWKLTGIKLPLAHPSPAAFATLDVLARDLAARGDDPRANQLRDIAATLRTLMPLPALRRAEPDIEALMQAEGSAAHPGPHLRLDPDQLTTLRHAILACRKLSLEYRSAESPRHTPRLLQPYGVLYGRRAYLVAKLDPEPEFRLWRLDRMRNLACTEIPFIREPFNLTGFAAQSFGVFQEDPLDITLRFTPAAAKDAAEWNFHPNQTTKRQKDGSLLVTFHAGGTWELSWHLFTWGDTVEILEPESLRHHLATLCTTAAAHHAKMPNP